LIDLTLLGLVLLTASTVRERYNESRAREQALLRKMIPPLPPPAIPPLPATSPAKATNYLDVAQHLLFSRDRNPNVILDPPAPPPPPKPMPALPVAYGVIDLGAGPTVILSARSGAEHHGYRVGETIGEFKLASITQDEVVFEWEGKEVKKRVEELIDKTPPQAQAKQAPAQPAAKPTGGNATNVLSDSKEGPGVELGQGSRACVPGDTTPAGTVRDGFRKVVSKTPFGESCRWEAVK
jgi:hypothetical protein